MFGLGVPEILIIAIIILLIFGAKRLPGIGEGLGKTVKELRNIKKDASREEKPKKTQAIEGGDHSVSASKQGASHDRASSTSSPKQRRSDEGAESTPAASQDQPPEDDMVDAFQKKMTKNVTDRVLAQVPGIRQARQLKNTADKIKKIVS
jgi:sec-independent protein translocase protein TatA